MKQPPRFDRMPNYRQWKDRWAIKLKQHPWHALFPTHGNFILVFCTASNRNILKRKNWEPVFGLVIFKNNLKGRYSCLVLPFLFKICKKKVLKYMKPYHWRCVATLVKNIRKLCGSNWGTIWLHGSWISTKYASCHNYSLTPIKRLSSVTVYNSHIRYHL